MKSQILLDGESYLLTDRRGERGDAAFFYAETSIHIMSKIFLMRPRCQGYCHRIPFCRRGICTCVVWSSGYRDVDPLSSLRDMSSIIVLVAQGLIDLYV